MLYWIAVSALWLCIIAIVIHLCVTHSQPEPGEAEPEPTEYAADYDPIAEAHAADLVVARCKFGPIREGGEL